MSRIERLLLVVGVLMISSALATGGWLVFSLTHSQEAEPTEAAVAQPTALTATPSPQPIVPTATPVPTATTTQQVQPSATAASLASATSEPVLPTPAASPSALPPTASPTQATPVSLQYVFPVRGNCAPYEPYHHDYPATDIFCDSGSEFLAPTSGTIDFVNRVDRWKPATDVPADRGGIMVALIGDDGVRYYGSHLAGIAEDIVVGQRVAAGQLLGWTGRSGNAASTPPHVHFGISRPTTPDDWQTRRGEVPPYEYLLAWERGDMVTPVLPAAPAEAVPPVSSTAPVAAPTAAPANLATQLDPLFNQNSGTFGVLVVDPVSGSQRYSRNAGRVFPAASLIKVPIAITVYQAASQGTISLDTVLTLEASDIVGGTGSLQHAAPGSTYTVRELTTRMLSDSDNTAANMLIDHLGGFALVNQTMQQAGATQTVLQRRMMDFEARAAGRDNFTTPADMALLLQQVYTGTLPDAAGAQAIVNALAQTTNRQKIPAQLPPAVVVSHKVGTLPQVEHDAGIVQVPAQPYILVVMSQGLATNASGINTIAAASRIVYDTTVQSP